jgi:hypothetical protein
MSPATSMWVCSGARTTGGALTCADMVDKDKGKDKGSLRFAEHHYNKNDQQPRGACLSVDEDTSVQRSSRKKRQHRSVAVPYLALTIAQLVKPVPSPMIMSPNKHLRNERGR